MATHTEAVRAIMALRRLPAGWDFGRGGPASNWASAAALIIVQMLGNLGVKEFDVVPGTDTGITIFGYMGDESVEIQAFEDRTFDFLYEGIAGDGEPVSNLTMNELAKKLEECGWRSPRFYVSCTRGVMSRGSGVSLDQLSAIPLVVEESQYCRPNASMGKVSASALTFGSITKSAYQARPRSFGESRSEIYHMVTG